MQLIYHMQLIYPWFLLGLISVFIPVVIHLLQLRRPQRLLFTNTAIIRQVELITVRHRKVQHLLILLARVLAVTALVFVFCQPFIPAKQNQSAATMNGIDVLVDNSPSMKRPSPAQNSLFGEAIEGAKVLGQSVPAGTKLRLVSSGSGLLTQDAYQSKLDGLKVDANSSIAKAHTEAIGQGGVSNPLYIFSDYQKNIFNAKLLDNWGVGREVILVPITGKRVGNIYVDSVWLEDAFVRIRTNVGVHVQVRNGGNVVVNDCPVKILLGTRQVGAFRVTVEPGQVVNTVVQVQVNNPSLAMGRVITEDAPVVFDNTYYFTLRPASAIRVLEIGSEPVTKQLYGNEPLFTYSFAKPQSIDYGALRQANVVLIRELGALDAGLRHGLRAVIKRGGSVVVVPSALAAGRDSYQQLFRSLGLGTVQWEAKTTTPEVREVAMPNSREPFFRDVFGAQQRTVTMPRVAPVLRWSRTGTDILRLRDGESYLADFASGSGRVYVFSAPFAPEYSDFVAHALFVPVMYRIAMLSYRNDQLSAYRLTQGTMVLQPPSNVAETGVSPGSQVDEAGFRFVKDSLTLIPAQRVSGQEVRLDLPTDMNTPGFYQVQRHGKVITTVAFNQDKRESQLAAYSADDLRQLIGPNRPGIRVLDHGGDGASLARFQAEQTGHPLWRYFLAVVLLCLLAEALLVRFGRQRGTVANVKAAA